MKKIVKYLMHKNNENNLVTPYFISNGGYFKNNGELIGITEDDEKIYVPETLTELTEIEFIDYVKSLTLNGEDGEMSLKEKEKMAKSWIEEHLK